VRLSRGRAGLDGGSVARESVLGSSKAPPPSLLRPSPNPHAPLSKPPSPSAAPRHNPTPLLPMWPPPSTYLGHTHAIYPDPYTLAAYIAAASNYLGQPPPPSGLQAPTGAASPYSPPYAHPNSHSNYASACTQYLSDAGPVGYRYDAARASAAAAAANDVYGSSFSAGTVCVCVCVCVCCPSRCGA
jgi:hypothetical protein